MVTSRLLSLGLAVHPAPATHDPLDVFGGAGAAHRQQSLFRLGRCHTGQLTDLGIGQLAAGERLRQQRQRAERTSDPDMLPSRARRVPYAPGQPGGARPKAVTPAFASVELTDEVEQTRDRGFEVRG